MNGIRVRLVWAYPDSDARLTKLLERCTLAPDGCLLLPLSTDRSGYTTIWVGDRKRGAARYAAELLVGRTRRTTCKYGHYCHDHAVAQGLCSGGRECPHRRCIHPAHLALQTPLQNTRASARKILARDGCSQHGFQALRPR